MLRQRLEIKQGQALIMTPQLMQAIKLLQLSSVDLTVYVEAELERNPLLERSSEDETPPEADASVAGSSNDETRSGEWVGDDLDVTRTTSENQIDVNLDNVFPDDAGAAAPAPSNSPDMNPGSPEWANVGRGGSDKDYNLEAFVSSHETLSEHLVAQLMLAFSDPASRIIGQYLIDSVDEAGYLQGGVESVADKLGAPIGDVEAVLRVLQTFEPAGICARNLAECLSIQLRERDRLDPAMQALIGHLDLVAKREYTRLQQICGVDHDDLSEMIAELRRLNPKPGLAFGSVVTQPIVPDVFVRQAADGGWSVELNSETLPRVLVNQSYYTSVAGRTRDEKEKAYLSDCLQNATWLVRALDQRAKTILKVSVEIVRQQDAFLTHGIQHLRPLNLKTIADAISMHESTVSRVTANKYMATNRGIFELKYFFTSAIAAANGGEAHSAEAVRHRIKQIIGTETADDVLSDDTIVEKLHADGIEIARRTVAKYREALRIPSSVQRRREKQMDASA